MTTITLPLLRDINRCLAHGHNEGEWCERRDHCARHITIRHDTGSVPACYRACSSDLMAAYIPIEGFPPKDDE